MHSLAGVHQLAWNEGDNAWGTSNQVLDLEFPKETTVIAECDDLLAVLDAPTKPSFVLVHVGDVTILEVFEWSHLLGEGQQVSFSICGDDFVTSGGDGLVLFKDIQDECNYRLETTKIKSLRCLFILAKVLVFALAVAAYLWHVHVVQERHRVTTEDAGRMDSIVNSFFPKPVRDRILVDGKAKPETKK